MSHGPHNGRVHRRRDEDATILQALDRTGPVRPDVDLDEVRLDLLEIDRNSSGDEPFGEAASACMVVCNSVDVVVEFHPPMTVDAEGGRKQLAARAEAIIRRGQARALAGLARTPEIPPSPAPDGLMEAVA